MMFCKCKISLGFTLNTANLSLNSYNNCLVYILFFGFSSLTIMLWESGTTNVLCLLGS